MKRVFFIQSLLITVSLFATINSNAHPPNDPTTLPLVYVGDFFYTGGFRMPATTYGASSLNFSEGPIEFRADANTLFIVGHNHHQAIGEFAIPSIVNSTLLTDLNMAGAPIQNFDPILGETTGGNTQNINRIGGMEYIIENGTPKLLVNAYEYYDAPADNTHTSCRINDADGIDGSVIDGYFDLNGGAGHASGWISPIPPEWQSLLGGSHIAGHSSGIPIISRTSVGPSAFAFYPEDLENISPAVCPSVTLLDFSLSNPLHSDLSNSSGTNDIWTHLSRATYGIILPGTRSYLTLGYSGGHVSGVCYKCTQSNGNLCGGYCAPDPSDYYQYYWLWDVNDLLDVKNGVINSYDVLPYAYGEFNTPFENSTKKIGGGSFDTNTNLLYLSIQKADLIQGTYANPPVIVQFGYTVGTVPAELKEFNVFGQINSIRVYWSAASEINLRHYEIQLKSQSKWITKKYVKAKNQASESKYNALINHLPPGTYFIRLKMVDHDGTFQFGPVKSVRIDNELDIYISPIVPHPVVSTSSFYMQSSTAQYLKLRLFDINGKLVYEQSSTTSGEDRFELLLDKTYVSQSGLYILRLETNNEIISRKIIIH